MRQLTLESIGPNEKNVQHSYVEIKCQLDAAEVFIADLISCSTCFGHQYGHSGARNILTKQ